MPSAEAARSVVAVQRRHVVGGKLSAPLLRPGIVDRPALLDGLTASSHAPVVLVSAPAGYGKTTLLALWGERDERPFAWVSLGRADNDPVVLATAVVAALDPLVRLDAPIADALGGRWPPLEEVVLPSLIEACASSGQRFVLVLDDVHLAGCPTGTRRWCGCSAIRGRASSPRPSGAS
jgi:LuxR family maltose regulon positive regulatory protein